MIIVEQNETYLVNFDNVEHITIAENEEKTEYAIISVTKSKTEIILGVYETEEKAKQILKEIISFYSKCIYDKTFSIFYMPENRR